VVVEAAVRELAEEIGIEDTPLRWLATERFEGADSREMCDVFHIIHDGPFTFADGEVAQALFVTPAQFAELAAAEPFLESIAMILPFVPGFDVPPSLGAR
jgi:8-oxo-dGTP pyrophosphatase MutT (NUDIX family)